MRITCMLFFLFVARVFCFDSCGSSAQIWNFSNSTHRICLQGDQVYFQNSGNDVFKLYIDGSIGQGPGGSPLPLEGTYTPSRWHFLFTGVSAGNGSFWRFPNLRVYGWFKVSIYVGNHTGAGSHAKFATDFFVFQDQDTRGSATNTPWPEQKFGNVSVWNAYTHTGTPVPPGDIRLRTSRFGPSGTIAPSYLEVSVSDFSLYSRVMIYLEEANPYGNHSIVVDQGGSPHSQYTDHLVNTNSMMSAQFSVEDMEMNTASLSGVQILTAVPEYKIQNHPVHPSFPEASSPAVELQELRIRLESLEKELNLLKSVGQGK